LFRSPSAALLAQARQRWRLDPARRRIVFCARMLPHKRPDLALDAFLALADQRPHWALVMIGEGPLRAELEASVPPAHRGRVIWTGFFDDMARVAAIFRQCDLLLLPSSKEPWGVVVAEAAAAGMAIVASDVVGAAADLVQPARNGAVFAKDDLEQLVAALRETTREDAVDQLKAASPVVLEQWLVQADPVLNFRRALEACGVLSPQGRPSRPGAPRPILSPLAD
jgi:glycosyltransferase involved in cell wall biosynthesis